MDTISILIITKWHNSVNIARRIKVLVLCTLSDHGLHLCQIWRKYLEWFRSYGADRICDAQTTRHTDEQTFIGKQYVSPGGGGNKYINFLSYPAIRVHMKFICNWPGTFRG